MVAALQTLSEVDRQIAEIKTPPEANDLRKKIKAVQALAPKRHESYEVAFNGGRSFCEVSAKAGELWAELDDRRPSGQNQSSKNFERTISVIDAGFSNHQDAMMCVRLSELTPEEREAYYHKCQNDDKIPTLGGLYSFWKVGSGKENGHETPALPAGKWQIIYADPPWQYDFSLSDSRKIENQYPTMAIDDICSLPVTDIEEDDCVLLMWATSPKLIEAMQVIGAWGFTYKTCAVWIKDKIGMGYYFRQQHELLLVATKGNPPIPEPGCRVSSVIIAPRLEHSAKPESVYEIIDGMYPNLEKIELFARNNGRKGWMVWGNQAWAVS